MKSLSIIIALAIFLSSCNFKPDEISLPQWKSEWLGPLAKISLTPQDIKGIDSIHFENNFLANQLGVPSGNYPSFPAINNLTVSQTVKTSDIYYEITFDSASGYITIINQMPFTIKAGTTISLGKNGNNLFQFSINNNIPSGSTFQSPTLDFAGKKLYNEVELRLEDFSTEPINNSFTIQGNEKISIQFDIKNFQLRELAIEANNQFEVIDTTDFSFANDEMTTEAVKGKLKIFIENQFPIQQSMQAYFMDSLKNIVDSLFSQPFIIQAADVDGQGYSTNKPLSSNEIVLDPQKFDKLKNAKFLMAKASFQNINNTVPVTRMRRSDNFDIQIVGDLQLQYDLTPKNQ
ncbi:MAG: hypothetical protein KatS3mg035_1747 [Bacteroidia bacterium]|nr:MAG: hypothetical protein KatS3mg035_1747 [Bacteroidia bacterium]